MPVRNRAILLLLMPMIVFFWCIGWSLYWLGQKREMAKPQPKMSRQENFAFIVPIPEQKVAT
jgi:hypothetical protein